MYTISHTSSWAATALVAPQDLFARYLLCVRLCSRMSSDYDVDGSGQQEAVAACLSAIRTACLALAALVVPHEVLTIGLSTCLKSRCNAHKRTFFEQYEEKGSQQLFLLLEINRGICQSAKVFCST